MAKALDYDIVLSGFEPQSLYQVHFRANTRNIYIYEPS